MEGPEQKIEPPRKDEVWDGMRTIKNNKSPGEDNISAELKLNRYRHKKLWNEIHALIEEIWASEKMSENR